MPDRIPTNIRKDTGIGLFGFEGIHVIFILLSVVVGFVIFRFALDDEKPFLICIILSLILPIITITFLSLLVVNKPKKYPLHFLQEMWMTLMKAPYHSPKKLNPINRHDDEI